MTVVGRRVGIVMAVGMAWALLPAVAFSAEHGGKEHGGTTQGTAKEYGGTTQEHGGLPAAPSAAQAEPSAEQIRQALQDYITLIEQEEETFTIDDDVTGTTRTLQFVRVHERVGKTGDLYYSCTDMQDAATGELLDLDFDVDASGKELEVVDVRIHKVEGQARYTYDEHDNRIPLESAAALE